MKKSEGRKRILLANACLLFILLFFVCLVFWPPGADEDTEPKDLGWYHISGSEPSWSLCEFLGTTPYGVQQVFIGERNGRILLFLEEDEEVLRLMQYLDDSITVVDQKPREREERYAGLWPPYVMGFWTYDRTLLLLGLESTWEMSCVLAYEDEFYEAVSPENFYEVLQQDFGMESR